LDCVAFLAAPSKHVVAESAAAKVGGEEKTEKERGLGTTKQGSTEGKKEVRQEMMLNASGSGHYWLASSTGSRKSFPIASRMDI
jgi:hypothetical protein